MKATEIFSHRISSSNVPLESRMQIVYFDSYMVNYEDVPYNYEYLRNTGQFELILEHPEKAIPDKVVFTYTTKGDVHDLTLKTGRNFLLPLIFLRNELLARLDPDAQRTEVSFWSSTPGELIIDIGPDEWQEFTHELHSIYTLHYDLTRGLYKRSVAKLTDEECRSLLNKIDALDIPVEFAKN